MLLYAISQYSYKHVVDGVRRVTMEGMLSYSCSSIVISFLFSVTHLQLIVLIMISINDSFRRFANFNSLALFCFSEGFFKLWTGASLNVLRAVLMTLSQVRPISTHEMKDLIINKMSPILDCFLRADKANLTRNEVL